jgi:hypothetical protein
MSKNVYFELTDAFNRDGRIVLLASGQAVVHYQLAIMESLIRMKRTQRAKDYPVIGELARLLPPERELELTTDPDRVLELAPRHASDRPAARAAREGRLAVVLALAAEADRLQQEDRRRVDAYERAFAPYLRAFRELGRDALALPHSHDRLCRLAERLLPTTLGEPDREDAQ